MTEEIFCPYKTKCKDHPHLCTSCQHNTGKKSYYQPTYEPKLYNPPPWYPYDDRTWKIMETWYTTCEK